MRGQRSRTFLRAKLGFVVFLLASSPVWAQQAEPPANSPAAASPAATAYPPERFPDGTYATGADITAPKLVQSVPAVYPANLDSDRSKDYCLLSVVVGIDGVARDIHVVRSAGKAADVSAVEAVKASKFQAGSWNQQAVPVRISVEVAFSPDHRPAIPEVVLIVQTKKHWNSGTQGIEPPQVTYSAKPKYTEEARRNKIEGQVAVATLITEKGVPTDMRVTTSLGSGLDEAAIKAVSQYRFKPATMKGKPVAVPITIEVNFQLD